jgi:biotin-(acetyl-CoA carboxylase) ligase
MSEVLILMAKHLHEIIRQRAHQPFSVFVREYERHHALTGKLVTVLPAGGEQGIAGKCEGIDAHGRLIVRQRGVVHPIVAGTVVESSPRARRS